MAQWRASSARRYLASRGSANRGRCGHRYSRCRRLPRANPSGYSNAGFIAVLATVLTVLSPFDITPIGGARSPAGLFTQGLAEAVGSFIFHRLKPPRGA